RSTRRWWGGSRRGGRRPDGCQRGGLRPGLCRRGGRRRHEDAPGNADVAGGVWSRCAWAGQPSEGRGSADAAVAGDAGEHLALLDRQARPTGVPDHAVPGVDRDVVVAPEDEVTGAGLADPRGPGFLAGDGAREGLAELGEDVPGVAGAVEAGGGAAT